MRPRLRPERVIASYGEHRQRNKQWNVGRAKEELAAREGIRLPEDHRSATSMPRPPATLIAAAADIALVLDAAGRRSATSPFDSDELRAGLGDAEQLARQALDRHRRADSRPKVEALLAMPAAPASRAGGTSTIIRADGRSVPVLYCGVQSATAAAWSRSAATCARFPTLQQRLVEAQQSMERDYSRLRDVETRYRLLFQLSSEAVLILDADAPAGDRGQPGGAAAVRRRSAATWPGSSCSEMFDAESRDAVAGASGRACAPPAAPTTCARSSRGRRPRECLVSASLFRQDERLRCSWCGIAPADATGGRRRVPDAKTKLLKLVESAPDGFVVTDAGRPHHHRQCRLPRDGAAADRGPGAGERWTAGWARPASTWTC